MATVRRARVAVWALAGLTLLLVFVFSDLLVELLWMQALGYAQVFWSVRGVQAGLFVAAFLGAAAYLGFNVFVLVRQIPPMWASRWAREGEAPSVGTVPLTRTSMRWIGLFLAGMIGLSYGGAFAAQWDSFVRFWSDVSYGLADPFYGHDAAFYMLQLPFIENVQGAFVSLVFLTFFLLLVVYLLMGEVEVQKGRVAVRPSVLRHLGLNLALLLVGWAAGFFLDRYALLTDSSTVVFGIGYVEDHVVQPMLWVMVAASLLLAALVLATLRRYRFRWLAYGVGAYLVLWIVGLALLPGMVRRFVVDPNELQKEEPYLEHNIAFTREAYDLADVEERSYPARTNLTQAEVQANEATLRNVRLWDPRLLIDTYRQVQEIRTYYQFYNVDIDRYTIDGEYRQVMVSGRELAQELPGQAQSWVNRHLQYTHGYGSVLNLAAEVDPSGNPTLLLRDVPPVADSPELEVDEPAIYYGERIPTYRIVGTTAQELDYPQGDDNVYTTYEGDGGVRIGGFFRQLLFAWTLSDYNILLSDYLTEDSRIQFWNRIQERVRRVAPFLQLDGDPYLVLADEHQYWVQDAYTTAENFPYGEPVGPRGRRSFSYIRNSVKVVVDAYDGAVSFYVADDDDPVLQNYASWFPDVFQPMDAMSETLRQHLRYPADLFRVQAEKYRRYHMRVPRVFYNNEDLWAWPREKYDGQTQDMQPYYVLTRLPGEERLEFLLMTPFTPENRDNMIGWMAAKNDLPGYGDLVVYEMPKDKLIYGPYQMEARIDQNTEISQQLTLWNQQGSSVIRGNLIVVPVEEAFLYVEPVFLIAEGARIPQLSRVIVGYGEQLAMRETLEQALAAALGMEIGGAAPDGDAVTMPTPTRPTAGGEAGAEGPALQAARQALREAEQAFQRGDFAAFGEAFERLQGLLEGPEPPADTTGS